MYIKDHLIKTVLTSLARSYYFLFHSSAGYQLRLARQVISSLSTRVANLVFFRPDLQIWHFITPVTMIKLVLAFWYIFGIFQL